MPHDCVINGLGEVARQGSSNPKRRSVQRDTEVYGLDRLRPSTPVYGFLWKSRDPHKA